MSSDLVPPDFEVPTEIASADFRLVPLGPEHNAPDHAAWSSSIEHIRATPGFAEGSWPTPMTLAKNLEDLERHAEDFRLRQGFTFTVLDASEDVIGCVYIYPSRESSHDARVHSWVRADRAGLDVPLHDFVDAWLRHDWPFTSFEYADRE